MNSIIIVENSKLFAESKKCIEDGQEFCFSCRKVKPSIFNINVLILFKILRVFKTWMTSV